MSRLNKIKIIEEQMDFATQSDQAQTNYQTHTS